MNNKTITIVDDGVSKEFTINKLKAKASMSLANKIIRPSSDDNENISYLKYYINNIITTGQIPNDTGNVLTGDKLLEIMMSLVQLKLDNDDVLLDEIFSSITYNNGVLNMQLSATSKDTNNIDHNISNISTIYKLISETLRLNYEIFFTERTVPKSSPEPLKTK